MLNYSFKTKNLCTMLINMWKQLAKRDVVLLCCHLFPPLDWQLSESGEAGELDVGQSEWLPGARWTVLHIVFPVVDVHLVCPTLMTNPLQAGQLLGGALRSWPCCGRLLPVSQLGPASLHVENNQRQSDISHIRLLLFHGTNHKISSRGELCQKSHL